MQTLDHDLNRLGRTVEQMTHGFIVRTRLGSGWKIATGICGRKRARIGLKHEVLVPCRNKQQKETRTQSPGYPANVCAIRGSHGLP